MGWLDPRLWLVVLGACAICLLGGYLKGRHDVKGIELAQCETDKAKAALSLTSTLTALGEANTRAAAARAAQQVAENKLREQNRDALSEAVRKLPACAPLPPDLVRRLDAAGAGVFMPSDSQPGTVQGSGVSPEKR